MDRDTKVILASGALAAVITKVITDRMRVSWATDHGTEPLPASHLVGAVVAAVVGGSAIARKLI